MFSLDNPLVALADLIAYVIGTAWRLAIALLIIVLSTFYFAVMANVLAQSTPLQFPGLVDAARIALVFTYAAGVLVGIVRVAVAPLPRR